LYTTSDSEAEQVTPLERQKMYVDKYNNGFQRSCGLDRTGSGACCKADFSENDYGPFVQLVKNRGRINFSTNTLHHEVGSYL
jgi:hypothetical protein